VFEGGVQLKGSSTFANVGGGSGSAVFQIKDNNNGQIGVGCGWFSSGNIQCGRVQQVVNQSTDNEFYKILAKDTTNSTSSTSGAVRIKGGVGIALNLNVGGATALDRDWETTC